MSTAGDEASAVPLLREAGLKEQRSLNIEIACGVNVMDDGRCYCEDCLAPDT